MYKSFHEGKQTADANVSEKFLLFPCTRENRPDSVSMRYIERSTPRSESLDVGTENLKPIAARRSSSRSFTLSSGPICSQLTTETKNALSMCSRSVHFHLREPREQSARDSKATIFQRPTTGRGDREKIMQRRERFVTTICASGEISRTDDEIPRKNREPSMINSFGSAWKLVKTAATLLVRTDKDFVKMVSRTR